MDNAEGERRKGRKEMKNIQKGCGGRVWRKNAWTGCREDGKGRQKVTITHGEYGTRMRDWKPIMKYTDNKRHRFVYKNIYR